MALENKVLIPIEPEELDVRKAVIVIGGTGTGKSTVVNMLYNDEFTKSACEAPCEVGDTAATVTKEPKSLYQARDCTLYMDTVGFGDPSRNDAEIAAEIKRFVRMNNIGIHAIIIVAKYGRMSRAERCNFEALGKIFDNRWTRNSILLLTYYGGELDEESKRQAVEKWMGEDVEIRKIIGMVGNRIILTDNATGRLEEANRPLRKECLKQLKAFIARCDEPVGPGPRSFFEIITYLLERLFAGYGAKKAGQRMRNVLKYVRLGEDVKSGECPICMEDIKLKTMCRTVCNHCFHRDCLKRWTDDIINECPTCRQPVRSIFVMIN